MAHRPIGDPVKDVVNLVVEPGCETGVYYILVGNLPFETSWQMLKDHIREVAEVDHVELFMSSTSGWVRLLGEDNFDKVLAYLNTVPFKDRAIMADGRNRTNSVYIRQLQKVDGLSKKHISQVSPHQRAVQKFQHNVPLQPTPANNPYVGGQDACYYMPPISDFDGASTIGYSDAASTVGYNDAATSAHQYGWPFPGTYYGPLEPIEGPPTPLYYGNAPFSVPYSIPYSVACPSFPMDPVAGVYPATLEESPSCGMPAVGLESRKLFIKEIAYRAREDEIRALVQDVAGADRDKIEHVSVPKNKDGSLKLIVFVLFSTPQAAQAALQRLNGREFMGRKLVARLARDGSSTGATGHGATGESAGRSKVKGREREKKGPGSSSSASKPERKESGRKHQRD